MSPSAYISQTAIKLALFVLQPMSPVYAPLSSHAAVEPPPLVNASELDPMDTPSTHISED